MNATAKLTPAGVAQRKEIMADMVRSVGVAKVEEWMNDPVKLGIINALAASFSKGK